MIIVLYFEFDDDNKNTSPPRNKKKHANTLMFLLGNLETPGKTMNKKVVIYKLKKKQ